MERDVINLFCYTVQYVNGNRYNKPVLLHSELCKCKKHIINLPKKTKNSTKKVTINLFCYALKYVNVNRYNLKVVTQ